MHFKLFSSLDVDVDIPYGETTITVQVTAEDVSLKTNYTVRVLRKLLLSCDMKAEGLPCSACSNSDGGRCGKLAPLTRGQRHTVQNKCNEGEPVRCDIVDSYLTPLPSDLLSGPGAAKGPKQNHS